MPQVQMPNAMIDTAAAVRINIIRIAVPRNKVVRQHMRLRFSIRDLLWLAVVLAMALGWWLDHRYVSQQLQYCYEQLLVTEDQLEQARRDTQAKVNALQSLESEASAAKREAEKARQDAQIFRPGSVPEAMLPH